MIKNPIRSRPALFWLLETEGLKERGKQPVLVAQVSFSCPYQMVLLGTFGSPRSMLSMSDMTSLPGSPQAPMSSALLCFDGSEVT